MKNGSMMLIIMLIITTLFAGCSSEQRIKMGDYNGDGVVSDDEKNSLCYEAEVSGKRFVERDGERYDPKEHFGNFESCYNISIHKND